MCVAVNPQRPNKSGTGRLKACLAITPRKPGPENPRVPAEMGLLETGTPTQRIAAAIADEADVWPADLVVAGTHGRTGVQRLLLGSVAEGIARVSPVPVLLIPLH